MQVKEELRCDTNRLYGTLQEAIDYLKEVQAMHPDAVLAEEWTGYEDMHMCFILWREETQQEMALRIRLAQEKKALEKKIAEDAIKRKEKIEQYNKLKRELGFR